MSAYIVLACEQATSSRDWTCPTKVYVFDVATVDEAYRLAGEVGWKPDVCPEHTGRDRSGGPLFLRGAK